MKYYIHRSFSYISAREIQCIGPFDTRKEANAYEKISGKRAQARSMVDFCYGKVIANKPHASADYNLTPSEEVMYRVWELIA